MRRIHGLTTFSQTNEIHYEVPKQVTKKRDETDPNSQGTMHKCILMCSVWHRGSTINVLQSSRLRMQAKVVDKHKQPSYSRMCMVSKVTMTFKYQMEYHLPQK